MVPNTYMFDSLLLCDGDLVSKIVKNKQATWTCDRIRNTSASGKRFAAGQNVAFRPLHKRESLRSGRHSGGLVSGFVAFLRLPFMGAQMGRAK